MTLHKEKSSRERILVMGGWGSGKTKGWADIAKWTKGSAHFYVLDTDRTFERTDEEYDFAALGCEMTTAETTNWDLVSGRLEDWVPKGEADDWLVIDSADKPWEYVQNATSITRKGSDVADRWMAHSKGGHVFSDTDWQSVNAQFAKYFLNPLASWRGHLYLTAPSDQVQREGRMEDSRETIEVFGRFGCKPRGNKHVPHIVHTLLLTNQSGDGWKMNTVKDRGRKSLIGAPYQDFVGNYLVPVAGWKL